MCNSMLYPINEYFTSIQGEGYYTGTSSFFIRMQGCNVHCSWCDTKYTWAFNSREVDIIGKNRNKDLNNDKNSNESLNPQTPGFQKMSSEELLSLSGGIQHIVITGGEPCLQDLTEITKIFIENGRSVQIETSATAEIKVYKNTWVTLSPKFNNPRGLPILESCVKRANEYKFPVQSWKDIEIIDQFVSKYSLKKEKIIWLQPISQGKEATEICLEAIKSRGWRISVQVHKFLNVR